MICVMLDPSFEDTRTVCVEVRADGDRVAEMVGGFSDEGVEADEEARRRDASILRIALVASCPFNTGIEMSMRMTSQ